MASFLGKRDCNEDLGLKARPSPSAPVANLEEHPLKLIPALCSQFYQMGWCTGTGGGLSIREGDDVYIAPSGVQKERITSESIYVFDMQMNIKKKTEGKNLKPSACTPLFFNAFHESNAGAVIHSHAPEVALITLLYPGREFRISRLEMIKGIKGHGYEDTLVIPIIENTPHEAELKDSMLETMKKYPKSTAILVRRHGIYIWGDTWQQAKSQAECYHYLFNFILESKKLGIDLAPAHPAPKCLLLDIEGTTTSISFVKDTLFPLAKKEMRAFMSKYGQKGGIAAEYADEVRSMANVQDMDAVCDVLLKWIDEDKKEKPLKAIQGLIWEESYKNGSVKGHLYEEVAAKLREWKEMGITLAIYSSGSVKAQKLLFSHSTEGDLTPLLSNYFDTGVGHKREVPSYKEIQKALGFAPEEILFLSDIAEELMAADQAGMQVTQVFRDDSLPKYLYNYRFPIIKNFKELMF